METTHSLSRRFFGPALVTFALVAGCGDSSSTPDAATDVTQPPADASTPNDTASPSDVAPPADAGSAQPRLVPVSAMGHDRFFGVTFDPAGNFYAVGVVSDTTDATADFRTVVAKFNASGALDTTFGTNGFATHNLATGTNGESTRGIVVQPSGKIVVAATVEHANASDMRDRDIALARFNANGMIDTTFGMGGVVTLDLSAGDGRVAVERFTCVGDRVEFDVDDARVRGLRLDLSLDRVSSRVNRAFRVVTEIDQLRAGQVDHSAETVMHLRAKNTVLTAEELVKVDGEQIHLG